MKQCFLCVCVCVFIFISKTSYDTSAIMVFAVLHLPVVASGFNYQKVKALRLEKKELQTMIKVKE